ncbi:hypothetical protein H5410_051387 [Solanum commersonii]|uniref:Uncharacterized protein n=1 Tax=Solanum commersonii TaxID=4109 RepID=A0A9J5X0T8_SOLCO|nr:hypothetical protein H5410_051387 [Solanum commersonii]
MFLGMMQIVTAHKWYLYPPIILGTPFINAIYPFTNINAKGFSATYKNQDISYTFITEPISRDINALIEMKQKHVDYLQLEIFNLVKTIKERVKSLPCLTLANPAWPKIVEADRLILGMEKMEPRLEKKYATVAHEMLTIVKCVLKFQDDLYNQKFLIKAMLGQAQLAPFDLKFKIKKGNLVTILKAVPLIRDLKELILWKIIDGMMIDIARGKGSYTRGRGRSSPSSSRSSYGSSSSSTPIIQKGGMSLYNLNSRAQERASSSIHLEDIPESDPLYAKLQEFITQKQGDSFASIAKEEVDDIKTYER